MCSREYIVGYDWPYFLNNVDRLKNEKLKGKSRKQSSKGVLGNFNFKIPSKLSQKFRPELHADMLGKYPRNFTE